MGEISCSVEFKYTKLFKDLSTDELKREELKEEAISELDEMSLDKKMDKAELTCFPV